MTVWKHQGSKKKKQNQICKPQHTNFGVQKTGSYDYFDNSYKRLKGKKILVNLSHEGQKRGGLENCLERTEAKREENQDGVDGP